MATQLSIIIVNYNVRNFTEQCLHSVLHASRNLEVEIIVADNASQDESIPYLEKLFPVISFLAMPMNMGFSKANNFALKKARGENILFLNPDTILSENVLANCLDFISQTKDCGAVGVRMINGDGFFLPESKRMVPNLLGSFRKLANLPESKNSKNNYYASQIAEMAVAETEVLSGAFMMLSKKAIKASAGFDADFFMYGEDIDLSYRILKSGLKNYYLGNNTILHFKGGSTQQDSKQFRDHFYGAMEIFANKHYSQSLIKKWVVVAGSRLAKAWAAIHSWKHSKKIKKLITKHNYLVYAGNEKYETIKPFLEQEKFTAINIQDLDSHPLCDEAAIIFYINNLNAEDAFNWMNRHAGKFWFQFHYAGSQSVVGSKR